jgi:hypothetical protein
LVTFENTETDEVVLFSVSMNSTISTRHARWLAICNTY